MNRSSHVTDFENQLSGAPAAASYSEQAHAMLKAISLVNFLLSRTVGSYAHQGRNHPLPIRLGQIQCSALIPLHSDGRVDENFEAGSSCVIAGAVASLTSRNESDSGAADCDSIRRVQRTSPIVHVAA